jgi:hypothetical protein
MQATSPISGSDAGAPPPPARNRRQAAAMVAAVIVALAVGGGIAGAGILTGGRSTTPSAPKRPLPPAARTGTVTGYIDACEGLPGSRPPHAAGTVRALRGRTTWKDNGRGTYRLQLPASTAATERVAAGRTFSFDLAPGRYVLVTDGVNGSVLSFANVTVAAGRVLHRDLPNLCK